MEEKKAKVRDLVELFHYKQITADDAALNRNITDFNVNRPGFELSGVFVKETTDRISVIGEKEYNYILTMDDESQRKSFEYLTQERVPTIIIARNLECPEILREIAEKKNFPVLSSNLETGSIIVDVVSFLEEYFAEKQSVHGVLMQVYGHGVLLQGESGIGKSEIALELLNNGHVLVGDDRIDIYRLHNRIYGESPEILRNMLEIRGVGIIDVERMFGVTSTQDRVRIELVINLVRWTDENHFDRLGLDSRQCENIFGVDIPKMIIPIREGRNMATIVEAAVSDYLLREKGFDSSAEFDKRVVKMINAQKGE